MKRTHRYRITLEHLGAPKDDALLHPPLTFDVANHDDLFSIIERSRTKRVFDDETITALALGMKLFTEVMLTHRDHPLFAEISAPMRSFIGRYKALGRDADGGGAEEITTRHTT